MRFRLATRPPLRPLKAWFDVPDDSSVSDILAIKAQICSRVPQLVDDDGSTFPASDINLFIDDFELLDDSGLQVIKENDLVHITRKQERTPLKKRKAVHDGVSSRKKQRVHREQTPQSPRNPSVSSSEDEGSSSDETTASSESSSSSTSSVSSSSTSTSTSSSTSSDSSVEVRSSKLLPSVKTPASKKDSIVLSVRPGKGTPSTRSRNARRRLKRIYEREQRLHEQAAPAQILPVGSANGIPLQTQNKVAAHTENGRPGFSQTLSAPTTAEQGSALEVEGMVTTLRNKNKKKGFKRTMAGFIPQRIVFSDETVTKSASTSHPSASTTSATPRTAIPRLITPSEKQAQGLLSSNMFVTSVEVESEKWDQKRKRNQRNLYDGGIVGDDLTEEEITPERVDVALNYGEPITDWVSIERDWDNFTPVSEVPSLNIGAVVGWKALAINPVTFSPETLVQLARIKEIRHDCSSIVLEPIFRPGSDEIAFGASGLAGDIREGHARNEVVEEDICTFEDALKASWKLVESTG